MSTRLFDTIATRGRILVDGLPEHELARSLLALDPIRIDATAAATWYWANEKNDWSMAGDTGPLRLPFDTAWIEWDMPPAIYADKEWGTTTYLGGAVFAESQPAHPTQYPATQTIRIQPLLYGREGPDVGQLPLYVLLDVDDDGLYIRHRTAAATWLDPSLATDMAFQSVFPALIAIGLMNCKNVVIDERAPHPMGKKQRRRGDVRLSYHVIKLPGTGRASTKSEIRAASGAPVAAHVVRGHFKTFTQESPLFGKRTGTYWWGWQSRGAVDAGISLHDYQVAQ